MLLKSFTHIAAFTAPKHAARCAAVRPTPLHPSSSTSAAAPAVFVSTPAALQHRSPARFQHTMASAAAELSPAQANEYNSSGKWKYLDVRTPEEFADGHAPGAVNVPLMLRSPAGMAPNANFASEMTSAVPDKAAALLVGCKSGARSTRALQVLAAAGYINLAHNSSGFDSWLAAGNPVEK